jgi:hypothetical protein
MTAGNGPTMQQSEPARAADPSNAVAKKIKPNATKIRMDASG